MNDELLNTSYLEQAIDQVLINLKLEGEFLTHTEKLEKIKDKNIDIYGHLLKMIEKGLADPDFDENRKALLKSLGK